MIAFGSLNILRILLEPEWSSVGFAKTNSESTTGRYRCGGRLSFQAL